MGIFGVAAACAAAPIPGTRLGPGLLSGVLVIGLPGRVAQGVACEECPPLPELTKRYGAAGGRVSGLSDLLQR
jgi:hypothetical protein